MMASETRITVIGIGNAFRRDDGVGVSVARRLRDRVPTHVLISEESGEGASLMEAWKNAERVILIDAVRSGVAAGTIYRFEANSGALPTEYFCCSTHSFGVGQTIELARALNQLPERLIVYGIEGEDFASGGDLSAAVERAAAAVCDQVLDDIRGYEHSPRNPQVLRSCR